MRIVVVGLLVVASVIVAQVRRDPGTRWQDVQRQMTLLDKPIGSLARYNGEVTYTADLVTQKGQVVRLEGHVRISGKGFVLTADRAEYRQDTGPIDAKGAMHVQIVR